MVVGTSGGRLKEGLVIPPGVARACGCVRVRGRVCVRARVSVCVRYIIYVCECVCVCV
jgi:hypothetical protein